MTARASRMLPFLGALPLADRRKCRLSVFGTTPALTALRLAGLLQWDSARVPVLPLLYQWLVRVAIMLALVAFCLLAFRSEPVFDWTTNEFRQKCDDGTCWRSVSFSQLLLPIGALLAFVPLWLKRHQLRMEMTPAWCELSPSSVGATWICLRGRIRVAFIARLDQ